jgi:flagellar M-ring protein FliF
MDFLNKTFAQIKSLFESMTPGARITAGLLLAVVVVSVTFLFRQGVGGSNEYLLGGRPLSSSEIGAIEAAFAKANLSDYRVDGNRIMIPRGEKAAYIGAMADGQALPADFNVFLDEAISSGSPFESRDQRDARMKNARQKELALIIRSWLDIDSAAVQFDATKSSGFSRKQEFTAMVAVRPSGSSELDEERVRGIRHLVSSAIAGLKPENVTVSDLNAGRSYPGESAGAYGSENNIYAAAKRHHERILYEKVRDVLSVIPGAVFAVNVYLDPSMDTKEGVVKYDPTTTTGNVSERTRTETTAANSPAGRTGLEAQQPMQPKSVANAAGRTSSIEETQTTTSNYPSYTTTSTAKASLVPLTAQVTISIPKTYLRDEWRAQKGDAADDAQPTASELDAIETAVTQRIQDQVVPILPMRAKEQGLPQDMYPKVTVKTFEPPVTEIEPAPSTASTAMTWLGSHWQTIGMGLFGAFSLLMVRSMVRSTAAPAPPSPADVTEAPTKEKKPAEDPETVEKILAGNFGSDQPDLRTELTELVQQDPDAAANVLRNWIGSAG